MPATLPVLLRACAALTGAGMQAGVLRVWHAVYQRMADDATPFALEVNVAVTY